MLCIKNMQNFFSYMFKLFFKSVVKKWILVKVHFSNF